MALDRTDITPVDDDLTETTGTVFDAAWVDNLCDQIDAAIATVGAPNNLAYDLLPDADGTRKLGSAAKSWDGSEIIALSASNLASGTVPDARFPATLPAASGANLTALNGSSVASGTVASARLTAVVRNAVVDLTDGATPALDASLGGVFRLSAGGNRTIAVPTNPTAGQKIIIRHLASGGARTLALNSGTGGFRFGSDITALSATASGKIDYIGCVYDATDDKWDVVAVTKGY